MICGRYGAYVFVYTIIIIYLFQIESVRFLNGKFLLNCMDFFIINIMNADKNHVNKRKNTRSGFTLAELLVVVAIISVLVAIMIPIFQSQLEKSREATDISNVRAAYAEVSEKAMHENDEKFVKVVSLKQKKDGWQSVDTITIGGIMHSKNDGDLANWKGNPVAGGVCEVSYDPDVGVILHWKKSDGSTSNVKVDMKENLHSNLDNTNVLTNLTTQGVTRFEIDSKCPNSTMVNAVEKQIGDTSLMNHGTWAYFGSPTDESGRYLFWTSVDTSAAGADSKIPVIISRASGGYFVSETITAQRMTKKGEEYVAIVDHIWNADGFKKYLTGTKYETLEEAYVAYKQKVNEKYTEYKETLPN